MEKFEWQHIEFSDGSNPYISKTKEDFEWMKKKYKLRKIKNGFWMAEVEPETDLFSVELE